MWGEISGIDNSFTCSFINQGILLGKNKISIAPLCCNIFSITARRNFKQISRCSMVAKYISQTKCARNASLLSKI